jgi:hypothetical protein
MGSAWLTVEYGDAAWVASVDESTGGDTNGMLNCGWMFVATGVDSPGGPVEKSEGLAKSEGEFVVAADMGWPRGSKP